MYCYYVLLFLLFTFFIIIFCVFMFYGLMPETKMDRIGLDTPPITEKPEEQRFTIIEVA